MGTTTRIAISEVNHYLSSSSELMPTISDEGLDDMRETLQLFKIKDPAEDVFYFTGISVDVTRGGSPSSGHRSNVQFFFNFSREVDIVATATLDLNLCTQNGIVDPEYYDILVSIGMCKLLWYWMGFACPVIVVDPAVSTFSASQTEFWKHFYDNLLLEFCYINKIKALPELKTTIAAVKFRPPIKKVEGFNRVLLPIGGGKDSLVAWHLTKEAGKDIQLIYVTDTFYEFESNWRLRYITEQLGHPLHLVRHNFHCEKFERRARSYLKPCGHPWAALVYFDSLLVGSFIGTDDIIMGHEKSADFGNGVLCFGVQVNHQYDKSSDFLRRAGEYCSSILQTQCKITSAVGDLFEIEIARMFALEPSLLPFHSLFLSCNEAVDVTRWCSKCSKCAFVYLIMSAWLPPPQVWAIFGDNLFERQMLQGVFLSLLGYQEDGIASGQKPFECIGTFEEVSAAVELTMKQIRRYHVSIGKPLKTTTNATLYSMAEYLDISCATDSFLHPIQSSEDNAANQAIIDNWMNNILNFDKICRCPYAVKELVVVGDIEDANKLLGSRFYLRGPVIHGEKRGRTIGYPTANIGLGSMVLIPADGVYAGWLKVSGNTYQAAISIGKNPTFAGVRGRQVEAFALEQSEWLELYDLEATLEFGYRLRDTLKFDGLEPLLAQMKVDCEKALQLTRN